MELQRVSHDWETQQLSSPHLGLSPSHLAPCRPRLQQELEPQEGTSPWDALVPLGFAELWYEPSKVYARPACWLFLKTCSWLSCALSFRAQEETGQAGRIYPTAQKTRGLTPAPSSVYEEIWHGWINIHILTYTHIHTHAHIWIVQRIFNVYIYIIFPFSNLFQDVNGFNNLNIAL